MREAYVSSASRTSVSRQVYRRQPIDPSVPPLQASQLLSIPSARPRRKLRENFLDPTPSCFYGDAIIQKAPATLRLFFQNVKGLSSNVRNEDYRYYLSCLKALEVDVAGLAETNTCWSHPHLACDFRSVARRYYPQHKVTFGSPTSRIDDVSLKETFQSGGNLTLVTGGLVSRVSGSTIQDSTGLGRWNGISLQGVHGRVITIITAYRVCSSSPGQASIGSAYLREYDYLRDNHSNLTCPRRAFLRDLQDELLNLIEKGHEIILMLDANSTLDGDQSLSDFVNTCSLQDLHESDPAPSTYIGAPARRIDYIFGSDGVKNILSRSGTLSYFEGPQSDHRGLFIDIQSIFLTCSTPIIPKQTRSLHTGNPELVHQYHESMMKYYTAHNMVARINDLATSFRSMPRAEIRHKLQQWDADQGRAMMAAEKCLSQPPKKYQWSPTLRNAAILRLYWKLRLRESLHQCQYNDTFLRWQRQIQSRDPSFQLPYLGQILPLETIRVEYNKANRAFRSCQRSSIPLRLKSYQDLLEQYDGDHDKHTMHDSRRKAKLVRRTLDHEAVRRHFQGLRRVLKPPQSNGISKILVPRTANDSSNPEETYQILQDTDPEDLIWETIVDREDIERHLLSYNRESFRAASESPLGHGLMFDAITFSSLSPTSESLLRGILPLELQSDDQALNEFLASFTVPDQVHETGPIQSDISEDDVRRGFGIWRESTSTSPSGRHLGHYKAIVQHTVLLKCLTQFLNVSIQSGITVPRWSNAVNVLIEKDLGKPRINRLRIIHLFEADFNFFLKLQWGKRLVRRACDLNLLHDGQHGSIPSRNALDPIMLTELTSDLCRVLRIDLARFDNDASACYDRILVPLGMLAARKCGMPSHAIRTHADALAFMKYTVKTVYGISESNYHGTVFAPLFGTGQGSGASPAVWLSLVVILLQTMDRLIPDRMNFTPISGARAHSRLTDAFVDDTSMGFTSGDENNSVDDLIGRLEHIAQTWEHLLFLSGGKLNLSKCSWFVLKWEWEKGRPFIRPINPTDRTVQLQQGNNTAEKHSIRRTDPSVSQKMLGVLLNPMGDFSAQVKALKKKADNFATRILSPRLKSTDIRTFHRSIYIPSMRYGLAALAIDEEELSSVQSRVIRSILQKLGVQSTIPTAIRHGPPELGGLGLYDLRTEAGLEAIKFFRDSIYSESENGNLLRLNLQYSQLEAGVGDLLLEKPDLHLPYLTPTWVLSLRQYLYCHNMTISVSDAFSTPLKSGRDQYIMQQSHLTRYSVAQQRDINLVRLYLQVTTLADMTDPTSPKSIGLDYIDAKRPAAWTPSDHPWPRQPPPTRQQQRLWKGYIRSSYLRYVPYWKTPPTDFHRTDTAIESSASTPCSSLSMKSLQEHISGLPLNQRRLLDEYEQVATDTEVLRAFRSKSRVYIASDGGLHKTIGTHGWVISTGRKVLFKCAGPVDGPFALASSTRCELSGCASSLLMLVVLSRMWGLRHRCSFRWFCDSTSAISRVNRFCRRGVTTTRMPNDADLLSLIKALLAELRRKFTPIWVKGHQDSLNSYQNLPLSARLNIDADFLTTRYRQRGRLKSKERIDHEPFQKCSISINGIRLTGQYDSSVRFHVNGYHLRGYIQEKNSWSDSVWDEVDFKTFGDYFRRVSPSRQAIHMKMVHNQLPLGERRHQQAKVQDENQKMCPCCCAEPETMRHFLRCDHNPGKTTSLHTLGTDICNSDHHPCRYLLTAGLKHWYGATEEPFTPDVSSYPPHLHDVIQQALLSQARIGWYQATKGFLSKHWHTLATLDLHHPTQIDELRAAQRMQQVMKGIFAHNLRIWTKRNEVLHSADVPNGADIRSVETAAIRRIYGEPDSLCLADRHMCSKPIETLLSSTGATRRRWLRRANRSIDRHKRDGQTQSLITSFFASHTTG